MGGSDSRGMITGSPVLSSYNVTGLIKQLPVLVPTGVTPCESALEAVGDGKYTWVAIGARRTVVF